MSNHYHLVLRINQTVAKKWDTGRVIEQWEKLYSVPVLVARYRRGETTSKAENLKAEEIILKTGHNVASSPFEGYLTSCTHHYPTHTLRYCHPQVVTVSLSRRTPCPRIFP